MKKCASCTKDLPDAALHCVFCGAKQPPAPAVQHGGMAKTAFGYSANDFDQMKQQAAPRAPQPPAPAYNPPPQNPPYQPPQPAYQPPPSFQPPFQQQPPFQPPQQFQPARTVPAPPAATPPRPPPAMTPPNPPYPGQPPPAGFVPASAASAKTMFVPGPGQPPMQPGMQPPPAMQQTMQPPPSYARPAGPAMAPTLIPAQPPPMQQSPMMAIPQAQPPPYLSSQTSKIMRPIEPWRDSLRIQMLWWGVALVIAFVTPLATSPDLLFSWKQIIDGEGTAKLPPLIVAAVGVLSLIVASIPMQSAPRGFIAAVLGLAGIAVPIVLVGVPPWQALSVMVGLLLIIPGLLVRNEYRDATFPRLLVTLGAIGILLPLLLPQNGTIPLVAVFKGIIELPGSTKVVPALQLGLVLIVVMSLLAWLPSPVTGAATLWAWLLILWALICHVAAFLLAGNLVDTITHTPNGALVSWIAGGSAGAAGIALGSAYLALVGYGLAAVIGKQLE